VSGGRVEVYSKPGCGLCHELRGRLEALRRELPFELVEVDITGDAAAERRFGLRIPVVFVDGRRVAEGRVEDLAPVRLAIEAARGRAAVAPAPPPPDRPGAAGASRTPGDP